MNSLQYMIYDTARVLLWPVLVAAIICLMWVLAELGVLVYELYLRVRYRDLHTLEVRALRARKAFADGKPRTAYRYLQQNVYSLVVVRFLFDLVRNYQTERLEAKPLKLLQEYEFYTIKRLERTRILVRLGPMLGLMGTLIPLAPALVGLAHGDYHALATNLTTAFSVTVLGLLIGGLAFTVSIVRDRIYCEDISDMEYLLELVEGDGHRLRAGSQAIKGGWEIEPEGAWDDDANESATTAVIDLPVLAEAPSEPLIPSVSAVEPAGATVPLGDPLFDDVPPLSCDDPPLDWCYDDDPFADLGPQDATPHATAPGETPSTTRRRPSSDHRLGETRPGEPSGGRS